MPITSAIHQKYGTAEAVSTADAGMYCTYGPDIIYEWDIDLTDLDETEAVMNDVCVIPDNALITHVEVQTLVAAATGTAIDVGLLHISRDTSDPEFTADPDGLLAAFVAATMSVVGEHVTFYGPTAADTESSLPSGITTGGVLIGDVTVAPTVLTASRTDSTAFTAGRVLVRVHVRPRALSA